MGVYFQSSVSHTQPCTAVPLSGTAVKPALSLCSSPLSLAGWHRHTPICARAVSSRPPTRAVTLAPGIFSRSQNPRWVPVTEVRVAYCTGNSQVRVAYCTGNCQARVGNSQVRVAYCTGNCQVRVGNSQVRVAYCTGNCQVRVGNSQVRVAYCTGNSQVRQPTAQVTARSELVTARSE